MSCFTTQSGLFRTNPKIQTLINPGTASIFISDCNSLREIWNIPVLHYLPLGLVDEFILWEGGSLKKYDITKHDKIITNYRKHSDIVFK